MGLALAPRAQVADSYPVGSARVFSYHRFVWLGCFPTPARPRPRQAAGCRLGVGFQLRTSMGQLFLGLLTHPPRLGRVEGVPRRILT